MAKEKNKPVPVRFNLKLLEVLKEEEKIDTPQQALNFLANFWENNRPAKDGFGVVAAPAAAKSKGARKEGPAGAGSAGAGSAGAPPAGLSGIDLSIWKAEQKEKNKGS
jgi:hypothetical protein